MNIRAKFKVLAVIEDKDANGQKYQEQVSMTAVASDSAENKVWSKWTPSGSVSMCITNPSAWGTFKVGEERFLDFLPVT